MKRESPLNIILAETPDFSDEEAIKIVKRHYNMDVLVKNLVSERDQNFLISTAENKKFVLKIANCEEDPLVTDFQIKALIHIQKKNDKTITLPEILRSKDGCDSIKLEKDNKTHTVRVVSYLDGEPLWTSSKSKPDAILANDMGRYLARLGKVLNDFNHPGSDQSLLWDMKQALFVKEILDHIQSQSAREMVKEVLGVFKEHALPKFDALRWQVIHNDMNPDNVLIDSAPEKHVCGMIDFGDMVYSPLIIDLAVAAAYLDTDDGNPMYLMNNFVAGYNKEVPLKNDETSILFDLIKVRVATTVAVLDWRKSFRDNDDPYLEINSNDTSLNLLERLMEIPREHAIQTFNQICASNV